LAISSVFVTLLTITSLLSIRSLAKAAGSFRAIFKEVQDFGLMDEVAASTPLLGGTGAKAAAEPINREPATATNDSFMISELSL
jgi:hypothetical protein